MLFNLSITIDIYRYLYDTFKFLCNTFGILYDTYRTHPVIFVMDRVQISSKKPYQSSGPDVMEKALIISQGLDDQDI